MVAWTRVVGVETGRTRQPWKSYEVELTELGVGEEKKGV